MELNKMNMVQLKALAKEYKLIRYSRLRKAELINLIYESLHKDKSHTTKDFTKDLPVLESTHTQQGEIDELNKTINLSNCQHKRNAQRASKLRKKSNNLRNEIDKLKSQMDVIGEKIKKASNSAGSSFKGKKIYETRSYKAI